MGDRGLGWQSGKGMGDRGLSWQSGKGMGGEGCWAAKQNDRGSIPFRLSFRFSKLWFIDTRSPHNNETLKWLTPLSISLQIHSGGDSVLFFRLYQESGTHL